MAKAIVLIALFACAALAVAAPTTEEKKDEKLDTANSYGIAYGLYPNAYSGLGYNPGYTVAYNGLNGYPGYGAVAAGYGGFGHGYGYVPQQYVYNGYAGAPATAAFGGAYYSGINGINGAYYH